MIWLRCQEHYELLGEFDPLSGLLREVRRSTLGDSEPKVKHGFFSHVGDLTIAVYGRAGKLFLVIDDQVQEIANGDTVEVSGPRNARHLCVLNSAGEVVAEVSYNLEGLAGPIPHDPTPFVEVEDFDIGLLASNVSKDPERRTIFTNK